MYFTSGFCPSLVLDKRYAASFTTNRKAWKTAPEVLGPWWPFHGWVCGPRRGQPRSLEEDCRAAEPRGGGGKLVSEVPAFPRMGVSQVSPKRCFSLGSRSPAREPGGPALPFPMGCFGRGAPPGTLPRHAARRSRPVRPRGGWRPQSCR